MLAESEFGRNSTALSFVRSMYTDNVTIDNTLTTHSLKIDAEFDSGVGSTVQFELECLDIPLRWKKVEAFRFDQFGEIVRFLYETLVEVLLQF